MTSYDTSLEPFGGHRHDSIGFRFHYHAHLIQNYALTDQNGKTYTLIFLHSQEVLTLETLIQIHIFIIQLRARFN